MTPVLLVDAGLLGIFVGAISVIKPLWFLGISTRIHGLSVLGVGILLVIAGFLWPVSETRIESPRTQLDSFVPAYQFHEFHSIRIHAPREKVFLAIQQVTAREIFLFRTLVWIRRLGMPGRESILNPPPDEPILDVATRTGFLKLAEEENVEAVLGTLVLAPDGWRPSGKADPEKFRQLNAPGFAKAALNFRIENCDSSGCLVITETCVYGTDASAARTFAPYWRTIYPGSALIRRMWLRAIKHRAENAPG